MKRILCAGIAVADIPIMPVSAEVLHADSSDVAPLRVLTGGDALNEAIVLRRLGVPCALHACVGKDTWGDCVMTALEREGVDTRFMTRLDDCSTTTSVILIEPNGERHFLVSRGSTLRFTLKINPAMKDYDIVSIGSLWGLGGLKIEDLAAFSAFAHENGIRITADFMNDSVHQGKEYIYEALKLVDDIFPSYDEGVGITGEKDPEKILEVLSKMGPKNIVMKLGAQGCIALWDKKIYRQPSLASRVVDTTGAGDNFVGAYLACMARGIDTQQSLLLASRAAARCVSEVGATGARYSFSDLL